MRSQQTGVAVPGKRTPVTPETPESSQNLRGGSRVRPQAIPAARTAPWPIFSPGESAGALALSTTILRGFFRDGGQDAAVCPGDGPAPGATASDQVGVGDVRPV